jgi:hypothetical protein
MNESDRMFKCGYMDTKYEIQAQGLKVDEYVAKLLLYLKVSPYTEGCLKALIEHELIGTKGRRTTFPEDRLEN